MKERKVFAYTALPTRLPTTFTLAMWLLLDRCQPPGWVWGATAVMVALLWLSAIIGLVREELVDPFEDLEP